MKDIVSWSEMNRGSSDDGYEKLLASMQKTFLDVTENDEPLFVTSDSFGLYDLFLSNLPEEARQHYNCRTCRHFVEKYGDLVWIDTATGKMESAIWSANTSDIPTFFEKSVRAMRERVLRSDIIGVFVHESSRLGTARTGSWNHMSLSLPGRYVFPSGIRTTDQVFAEYKENFDLLYAYAKKYGRNSVWAVEKAIFYLDSEKFYRGDKFIPEAKWFLSLLQSFRKTRMWKNVVWYYTATAPAGYCHISNGVLGTLIDDIAAGLDYDEIKSRYESKMNPLKYQRPQAAPAAGNVQEAEKIVAKLGIADSLERRYARLEEIPTIWKPTVKTNGSRSTGIFGQVKTKSRSRTGNRYPNVNMDDVITMTWEKFRRKVLPDAESIEYFVPDEETSYGAIVTAQNPYAPPIIKWDLPEKRNPASWYLYAGGSDPSYWSLRPREFVPVNAIALQPNLWNDELSDYGNGKGVFFILDGAKDLRSDRAGASLFPEILISSLRSVRSTIEAYSKMSKMQGAELASACGLRLQFGCEWNAPFKVRTGFGTAVYRLDRWD